MCSAIDQAAADHLNKASDFEAIRSTVREVARMEPPFSDERFATVHPI